MDNWEPELKLLAEHGVVLSAGLTETELSSAEEYLRSPFPPDLRSLLCKALPVGKGFPDWRCLRSNALAQQMSSPLEGLVFDIQHNGFWWPAWSARPASLDDAVSVAREHVERAPRLIPVYSHRFIPSEPMSEGNPVFSVQQTDIIIYGNNLSLYLKAEFARGRGLEAGVPAPRRIRFWSDLVEWNDRNAD